MGDNMNYKDKYLFYCSKLNDCMTKEEVKVHNAAMKELAKLYKDVKDIDNKDFLFDLLNDTNPRTRCLVAAHCLGLGVFIKKAKFVLYKISLSNKNQMVALEAKMTLKVYKEQGYLNF